MYIPVCRDQRDLETCRCVVNGLLCNMDLVAYFLAYLFVVLMAISAPHIQDQPKLNETAYKIHEDVRLPCVADGNPEFVIIIVLSQLFFCVQREFIVDVSKCTQEPCYAQK